jgi:nucleotide-binding universal stress UspA family protein
MGKKILVPITPSDISRKVIRLADRWAALIQADLHFLHVVNLNLNESLPFLLRKNSTKNDQKALESFLKLQRITATYSASSHLGHIADIILEEEQRDSYDFILMAAHSHTILSRLLLGSVSDAVLHNSRGPVCFYKQSESRITDNIIVPLDYSEPNQKVIQLADAYGKTINGKLFFIHVVSPNPALFFNPTTTSKSELKKEDEALALGFSETKRRKEADKMNEYINRQSIRCDYSTIVEFGKPYQKITELQKRTGAGLTMMATHSYSNKTRILPGSITKAVLHQAEASVFVYKKRKS